MDISITQELPQHAADIERLLDLAFGPQRTANTVYRLREGVAPVDELCLVALDADGALHGTIRYWPVRLGGAVPSLLLGPIAVAPDRRNTGVGAALIRHSLNRAATLGWHSVILVGDAPYYGQFGFSRAHTLGLSLPGPVEPERFLGLELVPGALAGVAGPVEPWPGKAPSAVPVHRAAAVWPGLAVPAA